MLIHSLLMKVRKTLAGNIYLICLPHIPAVFMTSVIYTFHFQLYLSSEIKWKLLCFLFRCCLFVFYSVLIDRAPDASLIWFPFDSRQNSHSHQNGILWAKTYLTGKHKINLKKLNWKELSVRNNILKNIVDYVMSQLISERSLSAKIVRSWKWLKVKSFFKNNPFKNNLNTQTYTEA